MVVWTRTVRGAINGCHHPEGRHMSVQRYWGQVGARSILILMAWNKTEFMKFELALNDPRSVMIYETKIKFKMALAHGENGSTKLE